MDTYTTRLFVHCQDQFHILLFFHVLELLTMHSYHMQLRKGGSKETNRKYVADITVKELP